MRGAVEGMGRERGQWESGRLDDRVCTSGSAAGARPTGRVVSSPAGRRSRTWTWPPFPLYLAHTLHAPRRGSCKCNPISLSPFSGCHGRSSSIMKAACNKTRTFGSISFPMHPCAAGSGTGADRIRDLQQQLRAPDLHSTLCPPGPAHPSAPWLSSGTLWRSGLAPRSIPFLQSPPQLSSMLHHRRTLRALDTCIRTCTDYSFFRSPEQITIFNDLILLVRTTSAEQCEHLHGI